MNETMGTLTDEELRAELRTWAGRVAAGEALLLRLIGELDLREAWALHGVLSCAHWVSWQLGMSPAAARERVRVARRLRNLPLITAELSAGRVSYAQVRAVTRVATEASEGDWINMARFASAAQLEKAVRGVARVRSQRDPATRAPEAVQLSWDEDGTLRVSMRISNEHAPAVLAVLEAAKAAEQADRDQVYADLATDLAARGVSAETPEEQVAPPFAEPFEVREPAYPGARDRAALDAWNAEMARQRALRAAGDAWQEHVQRQAEKALLPARYATLADGLVRALTRPESLKPVTVKLFVDPVSGWTRTSSGELFPRTVADLRAHDLGRSSRLVNAPLRAHLGAVDGERCRFPSCNRTRNLHAHHVAFWSAGGPTDLANLVLVCERHHTVIHSQGFQLVLSEDRTLTVRTAQDIPVPHHPTLPAGAVQSLDATVAPYVSQWANDPFDLGFVVEVLLQHSR